MLQLSPAEASSSGVYCKESWHFLLVFKSGEGSGLQVTVLSFTWR